MKKLILILFLTSCAKKEIKPIIPAKEEITINTYKSYVYALHDYVNFKVYKNGLEINKLGESVSTGDKILIYVEPTTYINLYNESVYNQNTAVLFLNSNEYWRGGGHVIVNQEIVVP